MKLRVPALMGVVFFAAACQQSRADSPAPAKTAAPSAAAAAAPTSAGSFDEIVPSTVIARWTEGGTEKTLTYGQLKEARKFAFLKIDQQRHQAITREVETFLLDKLMEAEAGKAGQSKDDFIKGKVDAVTAEEAKAFYDQQATGNQRMPPFDQIEERIRSFLAMSKTAEKVKADANLKIDVPEPQVPMASFKLDGRPSKGPDDAKVTIVEFSDFQCPFCARATAPVEEILKAFPEKVKVYFLHFPLNFHPQAMPAAVASRCAQNQGKFWEMHDEIFKNQKKIMPEDLKGYAKTVGLDMKKYEACTKNPETTAFVQADMQQGTEAGVGGTPSFYINGKQHQGPPSVADIQKLL